MITVHITKLVYKRPAGYGSTYLDYENILRKKGKARFRYYKHSYLVVIPVKYKRKNIFDIEIVEN